MSLFIDITKFINHVEQEGALPAITIERIKAKRVEVKASKGVYSENDMMGKLIASGHFAEPASAVFNRWARKEYRDEIGDCDG